ncbi:hypothetical protein DFQ30_007009 [Apophysomyces sp. BC1015]|nr:hypothetical protein DFQ30_007009 [Apophysomyces sp. BC1015]
MAVSGLGDEPTQKPQQGTHPELKNSHSTETPRSKRRPRKKKPASTSTPSSKSTERIKNVPSDKHAEGAHTQEKRIKKPVKAAVAVTSNEDHADSSIIADKTKQGKVAEEIVTKKKKSRRGKKKTELVELQSTEGKDKPSSMPELPIDDKPKEGQGHSLKDEKNEGNVKPDSSPAKEKKKRNKKRKPKANLEDNAQAENKTDSTSSNTENVKPTNVPLKASKSRDQSSFSKLCKPQRRFSNETVPIQVNVYPHISTSARSTRAHDIEERNISHQLAHAISPESIHFAPSREQWRSAGDRTLQSRSQNQPPPPLHPRVHLPTPKVPLKDSHVDLKNEHRQRQITKENTAPVYLHPDDHVPPNRKARYTPYLNPSNVESALVSGEFYRGTLRINKRLRQDAYVTSDGLDSDIYICGQRDRNRAMEGDVVAVRLLDVDKVWKLRKDKEKQRKGHLAASPPEDKNPDGENNDVNGEDKAKPKYCGEVVFILERVSDQLLSGTLSMQRPQVSMPAKKEEEEGNEIGGNDQIDDAEDMEKAKQQQQQSQDTQAASNARIAWFKPTDKRAPFVIIPIRFVPQEFLKNEEEFKDMILVASLTRWPIHSQHPFGKIIKKLGHIGEFAAETQAILADNGIKQTPYKMKDLFGLPTASWTIPEQEYEKRKDLRDVQIFTIDPATAKDLDDAVHITRLENDYFEVGVHIADVSYFLRANTPLDTEAYDRGTSTYLVDKVIPMLPSRLCEDLCSLNPGVERLAFSVIWKLDKTGKVFDTWFGRTVIKSCAKLAYGDAQSVIEGHGLPDTVQLFDHSVKLVEESIQNLFTISQNMRKRRFENGALSISSIRLSFKLNEAGEPEDVFIYELKEANRLIEEFMLLANMSVAEKICKHFPKEALLRRHEPPIARRLEEFLNHMDDLGYNFDVSSAGTLQASFNAIESDDVKSVLRILAVKPMRRAKYFCTGTLDISKYLHFALNVPLYTHFTSPIRRYADVIVHRQLEAALEQKEGSGYETKKAQRMAFHCNRKKDGAKNAQEQNIMLYLARYLANLQEKGPIIRNAICLQVGEEAFDVLVPEYGLERRIHADALPIERHTFDAQNMSLAVYWKKGQALTTDVPENSSKPKYNVSIEDASESDEDEVSEMATDDYTCLEDDDIEKPCPGKAIVKIPDNVIVLDKELDADTCMQRFKAFSKLDVIIKVDMHHSPPFINLYPVNPFADASS